MKKLRERWTDELNSSVESVLHPKGKHAQIRKVRLDDFPLPWESEDGVIDLRGLKLNRISAVHAVGVDLSFCSSKINEYGRDQLLQVTSGIFERCQFIKSKKFHRLHGTYRDCNFTDVVFDGGAISGTFFDCNFTRSRINKAIISGRFVHCKFDEARFPRADFSEATLEDCSFDKADFSRSVFVYKDEFLEVEPKGKTIKVNFGLNGGVSVQC